MFKRTSSSLKAHLCLLREVLTSSCFLWFRDRTELINVFITVFVINKGSSEVPTGRLANCHLVDRYFSPVAKSDAKNLENDTGNMLTSPKLALTNLGLVSRPFICLKLCPIIFFYKTYSQQAMTMWKGKSMLYTIYILWTTAHQHQQLLLPQKSLLIA